jgi:hypothetical protein
MHRAAAERAWWKKVGIDPIKIARKLWRETRLKEGRIKQSEEPAARAQISSGVPFD